MSGRFSSRLHPLFPFLAGAGAGLWGCASGGVAQDVFLPEDVIEFASLSPGEASTQWLRIYNAGQLELQLAAEVQGDGAADFTLGTLPPLLGAHQQVDLPITYSPTAATTSFATLELLTNDPDEEKISVVLLGSAVPEGAQVRLSPGYLDFGSVYTGSTSSLPLYVEVTGEDDLVLSDVVNNPGLDEGSAAGFTVEPPAGGRVIPSGSTALLEVHYTAQDLLEARGTLVLLTEDPYQPEVRVSLTANGPGATNNTDPRVLLVSPLETRLWYDFETLNVEFRVGDAEQPPESLYVGLESSLDGFIEDETPDPSGLVTFSIYVDYANFTPGTHTFTGTVIDAFNGRSQAQFTAYFGDTTPVGDTDGDGYTYGGSPGDCAEGDSRRHPFALESTNGQDDDCDGVIDEGTTAFDDDGDGFSEEEGDCNDETSSAAPGLSEVTDDLDNDCNGAVDDGTTRYDDDGDTFTEAQGDCGDDDPSVFPGASEGCDEVDNDCNGLVDDACIDTHLRVTVVGDTILIDKTLVEVGSEVEMSIFVIADDLESLAFDWGADGGEFREESGTEAVWKAPDAPGRYTAWCQVVDPATGEDAWGFVEITATQSASTGGTPGSGGNSGGGGCDVAPISSPRLLALFLLPWLIRRRR